MILGESIDPEISGLGFVVVGTLLQKGLGLNFEFIGEFLVPKNNDSRYLNKAAFEKHDIEVLFQDDESGEFRDALKSYGILSDLNWQNIRCFWWFYQIAKKKFLSIGLID